MSRHFVAADLDPMETRTPHTSPSAMYRSMYVCMYVC